MIPLFSHDDIAIYHIKHVSLRDAVAGKKNSLLRVRKLLQVFEKTRFCSAASDFSLLSGEWQGTDSGLADAIGCEICGLVSVPRADDPRCPRCDSMLHERKPNSVARTWALVIAASVLYIPANYYPVLSVVQFGAGQPSPHVAHGDTIEGDKI